MRYILTYEAPRRMTHSQEEQEKVSSSQDTLLIREERSSVSALVNGLNACLSGGDVSENKAKVKVEKMAATSNQDENKQQSVYPWLSAFEEASRSALGTKNMKRLENLMTTYRGYVSESIKVCYTRPNRAAKLRKCLNQTLLFFHVYYQDVKKPVKRSSYLDLMSDLVAMYMDMEIKAACRQKEKVKKITSRMTSALYLLLDKSEDHVLDSILRAKLFNKQNRDVCLPVLGKIVNQVPTPLNEMEYVRYLLLFKLFKKVCSKKEKKQKSDEETRINKLAVLKLKPPDGFVEKSKIFTDVLPKIPPKSKKNITHFFMQAKINLKTACAAFLNGIKDFRTRLYGTAEKDLFSGKRLPVYPVNSEKVEGGAGCLNGFLSDMWANVDLKSMVQNSQVKDVPSNKKELTGKKDTAKVKKKKQLKNMGIKDKKENLKLIRKKKQKKNKILGVCGDTLSMLEDNAVSLKKRKGEAKKKKKLESKSETSSESTDESVNLPEASSIVDSLFKDMEALRKTPNQNFSFLSGTSGTSNVSEDSQNVVSTGIVLKHEAKNDEEMPDVSKITCETSSGNERSSTSVSSHNPALGPAAAVCSPVRPPLVSSYTSNRPPPPPPVPSFATSLEQPSTTTPQGGPPVYLGPKEFFNTAHLNRATDSRSASPATPTTHASATPHGAACSTMSSPRNVPNMCAGLPAGFTPSIPPPPLPTYPPPSPPPPPPPPPPPSSSALCGHVSSSYTAPSLSSSASLQPPLPRSPAPIPPPPPSAPAPSMGFTFPSMSCPPPPLSFFFSIPPPPAPPSSLTHGMHPSSVHLPPLGRSTAVPPPSHSSALARHPPPNQVSSAHHSQTQNPPQNSSAQMLLPPPIPPTLPSSHTPHSNPPPHHQMYPLTSSATTSFSASSMPSSTSQTPPQRTSNSTSHSVSSYSSHQSEYSRTASSARSLSIDASHSPKRQCLSSPHYGKQSVNNQRSSSPQSSTATGNARQRSHRSSSPPHASPGSSKPMPITLVPDYDSPSPPPSSATPPPSRDSSTPPLLPTSYGPSLSFLSRTPASTPSVSRESTLPSHTSQGHSGSSVFNRGHSTSSSLQKSTTPPLHLRGTSTPLSPSHTTSTSNSSLSTPISHPSSRTSSSSHPSSRSSSTLHPSRSVPSSHSSVPPVSHASPTPAPQSCASLTQTTLSCASTTTPLVSHIAVTSSQASRVSSTLPPKSYNSTTRPSISQISVTPFSASHVSTASSSTRESIETPASLSRITHTPPPVSQVTTSTPVSRVTTTPPPVSQVTSTPLLHSRVNTTPPLTSHVTTTPPPTSRVSSAATPVSCDTITPPIVPRVTTTPPPISQVTSTPSPISHTTNITTPVSHVTSAPMPVSHSTTTLPPVSGAAATLPPVSREITTLPLISRDTSTPPLVSRVTTPPQPVAPVTTTPPPVSRAKPTQLPVSPVTSSATPVSRVTTTPPPPVSHVTTPVSRVTTPPVSRVTTPPVSRVTTPPVSRVTTPPVSRVTTPSVSRVTTPPVSRVTTPPVSRVTTPPVSRVTTPPVSRVTTPPVSRILTPPPVTRVTSNLPPVSRDTTTPPVSHVTSAPTHVSHVTCSPLPVSGAATTLSTVSRDPRTQPLASRVTSTPTPSSCGTSTPPPVSRGISTPPPISRGITTQLPPVSRGTSTPPPVARVTATPPPVARVTATPPPVARVTATPPPVARVTATPPPVARVTATPPPVARVTATPPPVARVTATPPPVSRVTTTTPPVSCVTYTAPISHVSSTLLPVSRDTSAPPLSSSASSLPPFVTHALAGSSPLLCTSTTSPPSLLTSSIPPVSDISVTPPPPVSQVSISPLGMSITPSLATEAPLTQLQTTHTPPPPERGTTPPLPSNASAIAGSSLYDLASAVESRVYLTAPLESQVVLNQPALSQVTIAQPEVVSCVTTVSAVPTVPCASQTPPPGIGSKPLGLSCATPSDSHIHSTSSYKSSEPPSHSLISVSHISSTPPLARRVMSPLPPPSSPSPLPPPSSPSPPPPPLSPSPPPFYNDPTPHAPSTTIVPNTSVASCPVTISHAPPPPSCLSQTPPPSHFHANSPSSRISYTPPLPPPHVIKTLSHDQISSPLSPLPTTSNHAFVSVPPSRISSSPVCRSATTPPCGVQMQSHCDAVKQFPNNVAGANGIVATSVLSAPAQTVTPPPSISPQSPSPVPLSDLADPNSPPPLSPACMSPPPSETASPSSPHSLVINVVTARSPSPTPDSSALTPVVFKHLMLSPSVPVSVPVSLSSPASASLPRSSSPVSVCADAEVCATGTIASSVRAPSPVPPIMPTPVEMLTLPENLEKSTTVTQAVDSQSKQPLISSEFLAALHLKHKKPKKLLLSEEQISASIIPYSPSPMDSEAVSKERPEDVGAEVEVGEETEANTIIPHNEESPEPLPTRSNVLMSTSRVLSVKQEVAENVEEKMSCNSARERILRASESVKCSKEGIEVAPELCIKQEVSYPEEQYNSVDTVVTQPSITQNRGTVIATGNSESLRPFGSCSENNNLVASQDCKPESQGDGADTTCENKKGKVCMDTVSPRAIRDILVTDIQRSVSKEKESESVLYCESAIPSVPLSMNDDEMCAVQMDVDPEMMDTFAATQVTVQSSNDDLVYDMLGGGGLFGSHNGLSGLCLASHQGEPDSPAIEEFSSHEAQAYYDLMLNLRESELDLSHFGTARRDDIVTMNQDGVFHNGEPMCIRSEDENDRHDDSMRYSDKNDDEDYEEEEDNKSYSSSYNMQRSRSRPRTSDKHLPANVLSHSYPVIWDKTGASPSRIVSDSVPSTPIQTNMYSVNSSMYSDGISNGKARRIRPPETISSNILSHITTTKWKRINNLRCYTPVQALQSSSSESREDSSAEESPIKVVPKTVDEPTRTSMPYVINTNRTAELKLHQLNRESVSRDFSDILETHKADSQKAEPQRMEEPSKPAQRGKGRSRGGRTTKTTPVTKPAPRAAPERGKRGRGRGKGNTQRGRGGRENSKASTVPETRSRTSQRNTR